MQSNALNQPATRERLGALAEGGHLSQEELERAWGLTGLVPNGVAWGRFVSSALLSLGAGFTLSGIVFFFAYNWADMSNFAKFGLIEVLMLAMVGLAFYKGLDTRLGKLGLMAAAVLVGVLLAVIGQTYQSGADSYALFLNWGLLIVGWVVIGGFVPLWLLLLVLINLTLGLYWDQRLPYTDTALWETLFLFNGAWLLVWEYVRRMRLSNTSRKSLPLAAPAHSPSFYRRRWFPQLVALATFVFVMIPTLEFIFGNRDSVEVLVAPWLYGGFTLFTIFLYSRHIRDLFILTICAFSVIVVLTSAVAEWINSSEFIVYLFLSMLVIGEASVAVNLLRRVSRSWKEAS
ncbi:MAG: DUF2157 domain-containing protein [Ardenticatenaceae bacterium]